MSQGAIQNVSNPLVIRSGVCYGIETAMGKCIILYIPVYILTIRASVAMDNSWLYIASVLIFYNITE